MKIVANELIGSHKNSRIPERHDKEIRDLLIRKIHVVKNKFSNAKVKREQEFKISGINIIEMLAGKINKLRERDKKENRKRGMHF